MSIVLVVPIVIVIALVALLVGLIAHQKGRHRG